MREALTELRCISEIMAELGRNVVRNDGALPAEWVIWFGGCVGNATEKVVEALESLSNRPASHGLHKPIQ